MPNIMFHVWKINVLKVYLCLPCAVRKISSSSLTVNLPKLCKRKQKDDLRFSSIVREHT